MELAVVSGDADRARSALQEKWRREASEDEFRAAQHVVDLSADRIECPACGTRFENPRVRRAKSPNDGAAVEALEDGGAPCICPACGLHF